MKKFYTYLLCLVIYSILFFQVVYSGIWYFWDWSFPIFKEDIWNFFAITESSWFSLTDMWQPLSYVSDYIFRFIIASIAYYSWLQPEFFLYLFIVFLFSSGSYFLFNTFKKDNTKSDIITFLLSLVIFINPLIFYKLLWGHINYLFSYFIFIIIVLLLYKKKDSLYSFREYSLFAILFALCWTQIQFFIFVYILFIVFTFSNSKIKVSQKIFFLLFLWITAYLIHSFWLNNFLFKIISFNEVSEIARWATFRDSYMVEFIKIIWLSWSSATLIDRFYNVPLLFFFWIIFLWILILKLLGKKYDKTFFVLYLIFISFIFIPLTPIYYTPLFPILREVWHIIPLIFLFLIFNLFWDILKNKFFVSWFISLIIVFICYNSYHFFLNLPYVSYEWIRKETKQMHDFVKDQKTNHRFIIYPFFTQYALKNFQREFTLSWFPLNNSGFDMILKYSWKDYINDSVWWNILNSLQWHLIETKDLTNLKVRAVEYILDFSNIYDSNFKKFISPDVYDWKERNLMTNRLFVKNLPGLTYLEDKIYKINSLDRINWPIKSFERKNSTTYNVSVKLDDRLRILSFLENFHFWWKIYLKNQHWLFSVPLFDKSHRIIYKYANSWDLDSKSVEDYVKQNFWEELKKEGFPKKLSNWKLDYKYYIKNEDGSIDVELTLYFRPQSYFNIWIIVSIFTTISLILILIIDFIFKKRKK